VLAAERKQETMRYRKIEIRVVENGYFLTLSYVMPDDTYVFGEHVFNSRAELYQFLDPMLELGTEKAGEEPEEWNHV